MAYKNNSTGCLWKGVANKKGCTAGQGHIPKGYLGETKPKDLEMKEAMINECWNCRTG